MKDSRVECVRSTVLSPAAAVTSNWHILKPLVAQKSTLGYRLVCTWEDGCSWKEWVWNGQIWTGKPSASVLVVAGRHTAVTIRAPLTQRMMEAGVGEETQQEGNRRERQWEAKRKKPEPGKPPDVSPSQVRDISLPGDTGGGTKAKLGVLEDWSFHRQIRGLTYRGQM